MGVENMGNSSKFDGDGLSQYMGEHGGLKTALGKILDKYLWRSPFVKVVGYKPASL